MFTRIMLRLSIPLFLLASAFAVIQLTNQMQILNEFHRIESRFALQTIKQTLEKSAQETIPSGNTLKQNLDSLAQIHRFESVHLFDIANEKSILPGDSYIWSSTDYKNIEISFEKKQQGYPYTIVLDRETKQMLAFIPVESSNKRPLMVARVSFTFANFSDALSKSRSSLLLILFFVALTGLAIAQGLANSIVKPIKELNSASAKIMSGELGAHVKIQTGDELEVLAHTFNEMSQAMKNMKERAEDANPLTQLPGNHGILHELQKRILERQKFVFFHIDLDRFKLFNDHFGLAKGDEAIQKTAEILKRAKKEKGSPSDFLGHQGGDDFVMITLPNRAQALGNNICELFDQEVRKTLYPKEDLENGYTLQLDRRRAAETGEHMMRKFPLLSVSVAGVSNAKKDIADYFVCMHEVAKVKKEAKEIDQSCLIIRE